MQLRIIFLERYLSCKMLHVTSVAKMYNLSNNLNSIFSPLHIILFLNLRQVLYISLPKSVQSSPRTLSYTKLEFKFSRTSGRISNLSNFPCLSLFFLTKHARSCRLRYFVFPPFNILSPASVGNIASSCGNF